MSRVVGRLKMLGEQAKNGDVAGIKKDIGNWMWSEQRYCGLRRDLTKPYEPPKADIALHAVPIEEVADKVFGVQGLSERDETYLERRRRIFEAGFKGGFVAVTADSDPAYLQWLIPPSQNAMVADFFGPLFPLDDDTLVVEGAWIPPAYRKANVFGEGLSLVSEAAALAAPEATSAVCFPELANKGAVRGSVLGGYEISHLRTDTWRLGRRTVEFTDITVEDVNRMVPGTIN